MPNCGVATQDLARMVRTIYQQLSPAEVHGQLDRVVEQLREPFPQVARTAGRTPQAGHPWPSRPSQWPNWQIAVGVQQPAGTAEPGDKPLPSEPCPRKQDVVYHLSRNRGVGAAAWWARCKALSSHLTNGPRARRYLTIPQRRRQRGTADAQYAETQRPRIQHQIYPMRLRFYTY